MTTAAPAPPLIVDAPPIAATNVDFIQARRFIELLTGDANAAVTFQTFDDSKAGRGHLARVFHGTLDQHADALIKLSQQGAGVFAMVNEGDGVTKPGAHSCRTAANVKRARAIFVDLDGSPLAPVLHAEPRPDWVIQSSPGRWHAYWKVVNCPLGEFSAAQAGLAAKFHGDPSVKDLPRVMRVPGFLHQKGTPFMSVLYLPADYPRLHDNEIG